MKQSQLKLVVGLPVFLGAVDLTVISAVLPLVIEELQVPVPDGLRTAAWMVTGYLIAYAVAVVAAGPLSDTIGPKRVFLWGLGLFGLGSVLMMTATGQPTTQLLSLIFKITGGRPPRQEVALNFLIGLRVVQAFGAGMLVPSAMSLLTRGSAKAQLPRLLGFVATVDMAGWMVGHLYGGLLTRLADWRWLFAINLPLVAVAAWKIVRLETPDSPPRGRFPASHVVTVSLALGVLTWILSGDEIKIVHIAGAGAALGLIVLVASRNKVVPTAVLKKAAWASMANVLLGVLTFLTLAAVPLLITTFLAETSAEAVWATGWMLTAFTLPMAAGAAAGPRLTPLRLTQLATASSSTGFLLASRATNGYLELLAPLVMIGFGLGTYLGPLAAYCMRVAAPDRQGSAASTVIVQRLIGMAVGTAALTGWVLRQLPKLVGSVDERLVQGKQLFSTLFILASALALLLGAIHSRSHQLRSDT